jgi:recombination protein RecA
MSKEKDKALDIALSDIQKTFGAGVAFRYGKMKLLPVRDFFPTNCIALDILLRGGIPREMITEMYGPEGGGKSTLALTCVGNAQHSGEHAAYIDVEHGLDPSYARKLGVDMSKLVLSQPDYGEEALQIVETLIESQAVGIIVVDSVAMLTPKAEVEGEIGDANVAPLPRLMAQALRKLTVKVRKANVALIFINQIRDIIGAMPYQEKTGTPGGRALKHNASLRLDVRRIGSLKKGDKIIGSRVRFKVVKSRICSPFQEAEGDLIYGEGFSREADLIDIATEYGLVAKEPGSHYSLNSERLGHGREEARLFLKANPELFSSLHKLVMEEAAKKRDLENGEN